MIYIGTSGFYYKEWVGEFYPPDLPKYKFFEYYQNYFNSLELNSTFYKFPTASSIKNLKRRIINKDFKISVKVNKAITHFKNYDKIDSFLETVSYLENNLGAILFQFPKSFKFDLENLEKLLERLNNNFYYAIEFRDLSWYKDETYKLLREKNIALVWHDFNQEFIFEKTANFEYVRFHGYKEKYKGNYPDEVLKNIVKKRKNKAFVYCNNTADNSAFKDAIRFKELVGEKKTFQENIHYVN